MRRMIDTTTGQEISMAEHFKPKSIYAQDVEKKKRMEVNASWRPSEQGLFVAKVLPNISLVKYDDGSWIKLPCVNR